MLDVELSAEEQQEEVLVEGLGVESSVEALEVDVLLIRRAEALGFTDL